MGIRFLGKKNNKKGAPLIRVLSFKPKLKPLAFAIGSLCAQSALAGGFSLFGEGNGRNAGDFGAGVAAEAVDASSIYYNPAMLVKIKNKQAVAGGTAIFARSRFTGTSTWWNAAAPGVPHTESANNSSGDQNALVPAGYFAARLNERTVVGIGMYAPFGLATDWGEFTATRYAATRTELKLVNIAPALGSQITDKLSIGMSLDVQFAEVDFNGVAGSPTTNLALDSTLKNHGRSMGLGAHVGVFYQSDNHTHWGLNYQSRVRHRFSGTSVMSGPIATQTGGTPDLVNPGLVSDQSYMPAQSTLSVLRKVNDKVTLMGTVAFVQWSTFKEIVLNGVAAPITPIKLSVNENFRDTWRIAGGVKYKVNDQFTLRAGAGYDQTPVNDEFDRNLRLPDDSRYALAIGGHYQLKKNIGVDVGWTHLIFKKPNINNTTTTTTALGTNNVLVQGKFSAYANLIGGQVTWDIA